MNKAMRNTLAFAIALMLVAGLCSCDKGARLDPVVSSMTQFDAYRAVLQSNAKFLSIDAGVELNLDELGLAVSTDRNVTAEATKFAVVDLENDGEPEIILWLKVNGNDAFGFEVLRFQDGIVCGYTLWYRAFAELKADGTFSFSSGAADNGFGTISFVDRTYTVDRITYSESCCDSDGNQVVAYLVGHKSATEGDFLSAIKEQNEKAAAIWYDLTDDNVDTILAGP